MFFSAVSLFTAISMMIFSVVPGAIGEWGDVLDNAFGNTAAEIEMSFTLNEPLIFDEDYQTEEGLMHITESFFNTKLNAAVISDMNEDFTVGKLYGSFAADVPLEVSQYLKLGINTSCEGWIDLDLQSENKKCDVTFTNIIDGKYNYFDYLKLDDNVRDLFSVDIWKPGIKAAIAENASVTESGNTTIVRFSDYGLRKLLFAVIGEASDDLFEDVPFGDNALEAVFVKDAAGKIQNIDIKINIVGYMGDLEAYADMTVNIKVTMKDKDIVFPVLTEENSADITESINEEYGYGANDESNLYIVYEYYTHISGDGVRAEMNEDGLIVPYISPEIYIKEVSDDGDEIQGAVKLDGNDVIIEYEGKYQPKKTAVLVVGQREYTVDGVEYVSKCGKVKLMPFGEYMSVFIPGDMFEEIFDCTITYFNAGVQEIADGFYKMFVRVGISRVNKAYAAEMLAASNAEYIIGINQFVSHPALNKSVEGFCDVLKEKLGDKVAFITKNAYGDISNCYYIAKQFTALEVDLVAAVATPPLIVYADKGGNTPVLGMCVSDYGAALDIELSDGATGINISGTSDITPTDELADMIQEMFPEDKNVGIVYCLCEAGSIAEADRMEKQLSQKGINAVRYPFENLGDLEEVLKTAASSSDVIYISMSNTVAASAYIVNDICKEAKIPVVAGDAATAKVCGVGYVEVDYYKLGRQTGEMAYKILEEGADISAMPIEYERGCTKYYNKERCKELGITPPEGYKIME